MTSDQFTWRMRAAAVGWLRYEQRCFLVCWERTPLWSACRPDLIGVDRKRRVIEIEFKQTISDFKANALKRGMRLREQTGQGKPTRFYFAVPTGLVGKVKTLLPVGAGLMTLGEDSPRFGPQVQIITGATADRNAMALGKIEIGRMILHQTGTLHRACVAMARNGSAPRSDE